MSNSKATRPLNKLENAIISRVLSEVGVTAAELRAQLPYTHVHKIMPTFLDIEVDSTAPQSTYGDGPLPARSFIVDDNGNETGEILVWVTRGYLSGLELAWVTDEPPKEWPTPEHVHVEATQ